MLEMDNNYFCLIDASVIKIQQSKKSSPVIITIPHDGIFHDSDWQGILKFRENGVVGRDKHIWPIVRDIILRTNKLSVVRGTFPRRIIDYNRSCGNFDIPSLVDGRMQQFFSNYHYAIESFIERALSTYEQHCCLLLDIHGFDIQPDNGEYDIILGTDHRKTIQLGSDIDSQLASFLRNRGYKVFLPTNEAVSGERYVGAYTVCQYSSKYKISAIQIEIAKEFRTKKGLELGKKLSLDLAGFIESKFY
jgi:N-formylglutamate amidohydrolase